MAKNKTALIYNPRAGEKRRLVPVLLPTSNLEDIHNLLLQYEIPVDLFPTKHPGHATQLEKDVIKEKYSTVLVAGGDGTVGEVVNGLIGSSITLGILPLGSFMNIARMLSIPENLEQAIQTIKFGRIRKIDVGEITVAGGKKLDQPCYFMESAGIGLEAQIFGYVQEFEQGNIKMLWQIVKSYFDFFHQKVHITFDNSHQINTRASMVTISNGPVMGAALQVAPTARLNDHLLTVTVYKMSKFELVKHFLWLTFRGKIRKNKKFQVFQAKSIQLETLQKKLIHADGRFFGETPIELNIVPNALSVYTGFPKPTEPPSLIKKTALGF